MNYKINYQHHFGSGCDDGSALAIACDGHTEPLSGGTREANDFASWSVITDQELIAAAKEVFGDRLAVVAYYRYDINGRQSYPETIFGACADVVGYVEGETPAEFVPGTLDAFRCEPSVRPCIRYTNIDSSPNKENGDTVTYYRATPQAYALLRAGNNRLQAGWATIETLA